MYFIQQILIFEAKNLILDKSIIGLSVFLLLESLFLLLMVSNNLAISSHLFLLLVVHLEQLNFCVELLRNIFIIISEIYESITLEIGNTTQFILLSKWRVRAQTRFFDPWSIGMFLKLITSKDVILNYNLVYW